MRWNLDPNTGTIVCTIAKLYSSDVVLSRSNISNHLVGLIVHLGAGLALHGGRSCATNGHESVMDTIRTRQSGGQMITSAK